MKLEIEKGQSGLKEKKRKEGEKKFSKYKTLLPMDSLALAFLSPTKQRSKNHRYKKKKKTLDVAFVQHSVAALLWLNLMD